ncbi:MAG: FAD-dependent oxidoreductase, partial [Armatimonadota bacterium]
RRRVLAHWHYVQSEFPEFRGFRLTWIAPEVGLREERRVIGEHVLTEHDLLAGLSSQRHPDIIAIADHAMDLHGEGGGCRELTEPYGVPFRCLVAKGMRNVLVASRASSFSSIAASSCRLSRTMMQLGQAAGTAAAMGVQRGTDAREVSPDDLREALSEQHVQLEWPTPKELHEALASRDATL